MKKPEIRVVTTFSLGKDTGVDNVRVDDMKPHDIAETYSEMIDALVGIKKSHDNEWHMVSSENYKKIKQALKKAGCAE